MRPFFPTWLFLLAGCDAPPVVSFNTPESCTLTERGFTSFLRAEDECGDDCVVCIEVTAGDRVVSYALSHDDNCVCPAPQTQPVDGTAADARAGNDGGAGDAGSDGGAGRDVGASRPDSCEHLLHLTNSEARDFCRTKDDCHVCVERVNLEGEARSFLAHQCGCPHPHRLD